MADLCRECKAPIVWVNMARTERPNPLDPAEIEIVEGQLPGGAGQPADGMRGGAGGKPAPRPITGVDAEGEVRRGYPVDTDEGREVMARIREAAANLFDGPTDVATVRVRISHFATCPHAPTFRGSRR